MAFNFNWSPLTADADFYQKALDLLTTALNKSPKPPIIVDDIFVTELNLGSVPPELEILEIGDLAEDRFRGIFKMSYSGDAFLTLRTKVQANPLNTYLSSKPSFTSPKPLAASSGLTIPLSITLSEIKLSAFIILVFSKQKGLTLVFRNDPLESLKVSSTFDSIQFIRDYLQRTIEGQLRNLMMDELPTIIHRLSLQLLSPEQLPREDLEASKESGADDAVIDPFANPPSDAIDLSGQVLDPNDLSSLALDGRPELQSLFSQKNLLRLAALTDSHRTLSLFTPGIRNAMFRAWANPADRGETGISTPIASPSLARTQSVQGSSTYTFTDNDSLENGSLPSRPSLVSLHSATTGLALGANRHSRTSRKKKNRVVNLRRKVGSETSSEIGISDMVSDSASVEGPSSEPIMATSIPEEPEEESVAQPTFQTPTKVRFSAQDSKDLPSRWKLESTKSPLGISSTSASAEKPTGAPSALQQKVLEALASSNTTKNPFDLERSISHGSSDTSSVMLDQGWITKMAGEIARRVYEEKDSNENGWTDADDLPPPAYQATQASLQVTQ